MRYVVALSILAGLFVVLIGVGVVGLTQSLRESDAGTAWCAQEGGQRITSRSEQVICISEDGRLLPVPTDRDGLWP